MTCLVITRKHVSQLTIDTFGMRLLWSYDTIWPDAASLMTQGSHFGKLQSRSTAIKVKKRMQVLLVHGSFHDERCWRVVTPYLVDQGFTVHTVTLSGHGTHRINPYRISMAKYAQDVCDRAERIGKPCVLLGHSMGGFVISAAAELQPERFSSLIYLTAFVPPMKKTSLLQMQKKFPVDNLQGAIRPSLNGAAFVDGEKAKSIFYNQCSAEAQQHAANELCMQPLRPTVLSKVGWTTQRLGALPKFYIECSNDNALPIEHQRGMQKHMKFERIATLASDHSPFLSMPAELAACLTKLLT